MAGFPVRVQASVTKGYIHPALQRASSKSVWSVLCDVAATCSCGTFAVGLIQTEMCGKYKPHRENSLIILYWLHR